MSITSKMRRDRKNAAKKKNAKHLFKYGVKKPSWAGHYDGDGNKIALHRVKGGFKIVRIDE